MRLLAPAKLNLCLFLGPRRADGLHELVSLFEPLALSDAIEVTELAAGEPDEVVCPGVEGENLAARALAALRERGWDAPPLRLEIAKRIPVAAGLGGGSADAAAVLRLASGELLVAYRRETRQALRRPISPEIAARARRRRAVAAAAGAGARARGRRAGRAAAGAAPPCGRCCCPGAAA